MNCIQQAFASNARRSVGQGIWCNTAYCISSESCFCAITLLLHAISPTDRYVTLIPTIRWHPLLHDHKTASKMCSFLIHIAITFPFRSSPLNREQIGLCDDYGSLKFRSGGWNGCSVFRRSNRARGVFERFPSLCRAVGRSQAGGKLISGNKSRVLNAFSNYVPSQESINLHQCNTT